MPRKGENIYKRKDGRWEARYIKEYDITGKAKYGYVYARSYHEVKQKVTTAIINKKIRSTTDQILERNMDNTIMFYEIADNWLRVIRPQIKESTYVKYRNMLYLYVYPTYKNSKLKTITHESVTRFCNDLLISGGQKDIGLSSKTVQDILTLMKSILKYAEKCGYTSSCNIMGITIKQQSKELEVLTHSEQDRLCHYLTSHLSNRNLGILICLFTGLRIGEICALRWEDISLKDRIIHVHNTLQRIQTPDDPDQKTRIVITTPKSKCSIRTIPLPLNIEQIMKSSYCDQYGYVLTGKKFAYTEPRTLENHFKKILELSNIEPVNFHVLRHTFATRCIEVGFDVKSLSEILGHSSISITMNRYVHPSMELKHENMKKLSSLFAVK